MIFLTVGSELPFDRLVRSVDDMMDESVLNDEVFAQIGNGQYKPCHMPWVSSMEKSAYDNKFEECRAVISHAGMGTILKCIEVRKPLLVMPRLMRLREIITDHQVATCHKFELRGDILVAYDVSDLPRRVEQLESFSPTARQGSTDALVSYIKRFIEGLEDNDGHPQ